MSHSCFSDITDEQVTAVHHLINFLRLLHIIGEIRFSVTKSNNKYSMSFKSYDSNKRKRGLIHITRDMAILRKTSVPK
jgi:hypothetical protein